MRVLCFGHSYCIAINRSIERYLVQTGIMDCTCVGPSSWPGDLRPIAFEPEIQGSKLNAIPIATRFSKSIHLFNYKKSDIEKILVSHPCDLAYIWQEPYCRVTLLLSRILREKKIPYVFFTNQNIIKKYPWPFSSWEKEVVKNANGWIACGKTIFDAQTQRGFYKNGIILPFAVNTELFMPAVQKDKEKLWKDWGVCGPVIGYVGRLTPEKGIRTILKILETLNPACWGGMVFFGSGPLEHEIKNWALEHGWQDKVVVRLVKHSAMPLELPGLDVLIAPSQTTTTWREQFGRMLIEAMASGVPIITSDSGEIPNTVGDSGLVVPEKDVDGFAKKIIEVLASESLRSDLIERGLKRAQTFSVDHLAPRYADFWASKFKN